MKTVMRNSRGSSKIALSLLLVTTMAAACNRTRPAVVAAAQNPGGDGGAGKARVVTVAVTVEDLHVSVSMPGSVKALESAKLYAKVAGYLERITVDIGDEVEAGQVLAVLSIPEMDSELRRAGAEVDHALSKVEQQAAAVSQAEAEAAASEADLASVVATRREKTAEVSFRRSEFERWKELLETSPVIEERKVDEAGFQLEAAEASLAAVEADMTAARALIEAARSTVRKAQADERVARASVAVAEADREKTRQLMEYAEIKAPFSGVITERHVDPGAFVMSASTNSAAMPLMRIQRIDRVRVSFYLPMDSVGELDVGDSVLFDNVSAAPEARFEARVGRISKALGERSRMMRAEVELDNPAAANGDRVLRPGYYGTMTVLLQELQGTPTVPAAAVFEHDGKSCVYTVSGGTVRRRVIETVFMDGIQVGIGNGLSVGEQVVSSGVAALEDGQQVSTQTASSGGK